MSDSPTQLDGAVGIPTHETGATMKRVITWKHAFWISAGVAPWVLFSIGAVAENLGTVSILIWLISSIVGFVQLFFYAELAGIFPNKTGGGSVYATVGWTKYGKIFAPINLGAYWFGDSTSLAVLGSLCGSYIVSAFFSHSLFGTFSITLLDLSHFLPGIVFQLNGAIISAIVLLIVVFAIQHTGIVRAAKTQMVIALCTLIPLLIIAVVPFVNGGVDYHNFIPFQIKENVNWFSKEGLALIAGALMITGWCCYGGELAVAYVSESIDPKRDNIRAILSTGVVGLIYYVILPVSFLGVLGLAELTNPDFVAGNTQVAFAKLAQVAFGINLGPVLTVILILALALSCGTLMAGSSRTLYQASKDGVFPKYLGKLNNHNVPVNGMITDLAVNVIFITLGNPLFVLAAAAVTYMLSTTMDILGVAILRKNYPHLNRAYRTPNALVKFGGPVLAAFNIALLVFGANVFVPNALWYGLGVIAIAVLIFLYRHFVTDKGHWPAETQAYLNAAAPRKNPR
jgi:amino acid transporter